MTTETNQEIPQEERVWALKDSIVACMKEKSADPNSPVQQMDIGVVKIANNEENAASLILHSNETWSLKSIMNDFPIGSTIDEILYNFALVTDETLVVLLDRQDAHRENLPDPWKDLNEAELALFGEAELSHSKEKKQYIEDHRPQLLDGLIASMETTLHELSS